MVLQRWDPLRELRRFDGAFVRQLRDSRYGSGQAGSWPVPLDVSREDDSVVVKASVPGIKAEDLEVTIEDGRMTIEGKTAGESDESQGGYALRERRTGRFYRAIRLPETVDADGAESVYENGVLTVTLPKQASRKARKVEVKAA